MPSVVNGEHMKAVKKYFDKLKIPVSGYFQWQLTLTRTRTLTLTLTLTLTQEERELAELEASMAAM